MTEPIRITRATTHKPKPKDGELGFGQVFTDHMFVADFQEEKGWYDPRVEPYGPLPLDPAAAVLHYAQAIFDGLKAFRGVDGKVRLFRPQKHVERMNNSARRHVHPAARSRAGPAVARDRWWASSATGCRRPSGTSLYIRPTIIASEAFLGVRPGEVVHLLRHPLARSAPTTRRAWRPVKIRVEEQVRARGRGRPGRGQDRRQLRGEPLWRARRPSTRASPRCCGSTACTASTSTRSAP